MAVQADGRGGGAAGAPEGISRGQTESAAPFFFCLWTAGGDMSAGPTKKRGSDLRE